MDRRCCLSSGRRWTGGTASAVGGRWAMDEARGVACREGGGGEEPPKEEEDCRKKDGRSQPKKTVGSRAQPNMRRFVCQANPCALARGRREKEMS
jgi:hypothetical protein